MLLFSWEGDFDLLILDVIDCLLARKLLSNMDVISDFFFISLRDLPMLMNKHTFHPYQNVYSLWPAYLRLLANNYPFCRRDHLHHFVYYATY